MHGVCMNEQVALVSKTNSFRKRARMEHLEAHVINSEWYKGATAPQALGTSSGNAAVIWCGPILCSHMECRD